MLVGGLVVAGNSIVLAIIVRSDLAARRNNAFVLVLLISDLLRGVLALAWAVNGLQMTSSDVMILCDVWGSLWMVTSSLSLVAVPLLLYDRVIYVSGPVNYMHRMTWRVIITLVVYNIIEAVTLSAMPLLGWGRYAYLPTLSNCDVDYASSTGFLVFAIILRYIIPFIGTTLCYLKLHQTIVKRICQVRTVASVTVTSQSGNGAVPTGMTMSLRSTVRIILILYIVYSTSWTLPACLDLALTINPKHMTNAGNTYQAFRILTFAGSTINPWLYGFYNRKFRHTLKRLLAASWKKASRDTAVHQIAPVRSVSLVGLNDYPMHGTNKAGTEARGSRDLGPGGVHLQIDELTVV